MKHHLIPTPALHRWVVDLFRATRSTGRESAPTADHPVGTSLAAHQIFRSLTIPYGFKSPFA